MELRVLGPAFGHQSIDAECAAAIALLASRCGNDKTRWTVSACHSAPFPLLIDGDSRISGYGNICHHLGYDPAADDTALTALIETRAPVLLQAYLYASYENFSTTRSAFTPILPFHARFSVPAAARSAALENTSQLGISNADVEEAEEKRSDRSMILKAKTVRTLLAQQPEHAAVFKLRNLADALLEPLTDLLQSRSTEVECLAYGYLGLMLKPSVPQPWLRKIIKEHYPSLEHFVERMDNKVNQAELPWTPSAEVSFAGVLDDIGTQIQSQVITPSIIPGRSHKFFPAMLLAAGSALVAGATWVLLPVLSAPSGDPVQIFGGRPTFSHVNTALAGLSFHSPRPHVTGENELPAQVSIELES